MHLTLNEKRYYSSFESIRYGAEGIKIIIIINKLINYNNNINLEYFKETNRNYFNDFILLHCSLGLW